MATNKTDPSRVKYAIIVLGDPGVGADFVRELGDLGGRNTVNGIEYIAITDRGESRVITLSISVGDIMFEHYNLDDYDRTVRVRRLNGLYVVTTHRPDRVELCTDLIKCEDQTEFANFMCRLIFGINPSVTLLPNIPSIPQKIVPKKQNVSLLEDPRDSSGEIDLKQLINDIGFKSAKHVALKGGQLIYEM